MPTTPKPLTAKQRQTATKAARMQKLTEKHSLLATNARATRDELLTALVTDGVRPFVLVNECAVPRHTAEDIGRRLKAAEKAAKAAKATMKGGRK